MLLERRCLAFDPGPKRTGWGFLKATGPMTRPHFLAGGMVASDNRTLGALIERCTLPEQWHLSVAIELPGRYLYNAARAAPLFDTSGVGHAIEAICDERSLPRISLIPQAWRRRLCAGSRGLPGDAQVKTTLAMLVTGLPKRTNSHVRDALGLACVVLLGSIERAMALGVGAPALPAPWRPARRRRR